jgi:hypothetical protein
MSSTTNDALDTARDDGLASGAADGQALGALWSLLKHASAALDVVTMGRKLGVSGVVFKAGVIVGAGVGMLLAPLPGAELRRRILAKVGFSAEESAPIARAPVTPEVSTEARVDAPVQTTTPARRHPKKAETPRDDAVTLSEHRAPRAKSARASSDGAKPARGAAKRAKRTERHSPPRAGRPSKQA